MKQVTKQEKEELSARFHVTEEQVEKAAQLIFDGTLEKDVAALQSLIDKGKRDKKEEFSFCAKLFDNPIKKLAFDILFYYGNK